MSSATSIKNGVGAADPLEGEVRPRTVPASQDASDQGFRPWHFFLLASLIAATAAVVVSRQTTPEHLILISLTIAAAGAAAAGFYRMLAPLVSEDVLAYSETLSARTRAALEREKMLTLRSIKELEFDRAMGKVSEKDFEEIGVRLRGRAIALMKELDDGRAADYRAMVERELQSRLAHRAVPAAESPAGRRCAACGTQNDLDAAFCKRCGARMSGEAAQTP